MIEFISIVHQVNAASHVSQRQKDDKSQKEVGESLGMYQVEVSRKERKILKKLRDNLEN